MKKEFIKQKCVYDKIDFLLEDIQQIFLIKPKFIETYIQDSKYFDEFKKSLKSKGGFVSAHWDGTSETEEKIKRATKATIRCIPLEMLEEERRCFVWF